MKPRTSRQRALRAAHAVALGGALGSLAGCANKSTPDGPESPPETGESAQPISEGSATPEIVLDATTRPTRVDGATRQPTAAELELAGSGDAEVPPCSAESDGICPIETCDRNTDYDCCVGYDVREHCQFDPRHGCICAVEGPFAPPAFTA